MQIQQIDTATCAVVADDGRQLLWNIGVFERTKMKDVDDIFSECNGFLQSLSPSERDRVFDLYVQMREHLSTLTELKPLENALKSCVTQIYQIIKVDEVERWIKLFGNVRYPNDLLTVHNPDDPRPDMTYLRSDYDGLVVLTASLRFMVPIWGELIRMIKNETGNEYKEFVAMKILGASSIMVCEPMERLIRYIESSVPADIDNAAAIVDGLSSEDIPDWLLSKVLIRRMAVGEIDAIEDRGHIISNVYGFVNNQIKDIDRKFGGTTKKYPDTLDETDDGGSLLELYKVKQPMTTGEIQTFVVFTEDVVNMAQHIDPTVPPELVLICCQNILRHETMEITEQHVVLVQWVTHLIMSPHAIPCINKKALLRCMGVVQAILWHWGYRELAFLATAEAIPLKPGEMSFVTGSNRIPQELIDQLNEIYPYTVEETGSSRRKNAVINTIVEFSHNYRAQYSGWIARAPIELVRQEFPNEGLVNNMVLSQKVAENLAKVIVKLKTRG